MLIFKRGQWSKQLFVLAVLLAFSLSSPAVSQITNGSRTVYKPEGIYHEAPQLKSIVNSGSLPQVDLRLPENPMLVQPIEKLGTYCGTWLRGLKRTRDHASFVRTIGYENLVRWDPWWIKVLPNIAERYEIDERATRFTFFLRPGLRWSDGHLFSADDILFWYNDVLMNRKLTPSIPAWLKSGGKIVHVEKLDDYKVAFTFAVPNGLFLMNLAAPWGGEPTEYPSHYLKQFHPSYNSKNLDVLVKEAGVKTWQQLFRLKAGLEVDDPSRWQNPDLPTLHAWNLTDSYLPDRSQLTAVRNPYYWKIDPAGNQLPYLDQVIYRMFDDSSELLEMIGSGEINMQTRHIPQQYLRTSESTEIFTLISSFSNTAVISLNLTHNDPVLRSLFQNKDFRIGLSLAIDRKTIIDKVFAGDGEPFQAAPRPESPYYNETLAHQYTEYNVAEARRHLDEAGCAVRDNEGYRLRPDGRRISINLDVTDFLSMLEVARHIPSYWKDIGIETRLNVLDRDDLYRRKENNQHDAVIWVGDGGLEVLLDPRWYFPHSPLESNYAIPWARWYRNPTDPQAIKPPLYVQEQMNLYNEILTTMDPGKQYSLMKQILDIAAEQFYVIGISTPPLRYGVLKSNFKNVPGFIPHSWTYPHPAPTNPCQYFIEGP